MHALKTATPAKKEKAGVKNSPLDGKETSTASRASPDHSNSETQAKVPRFDLNIEIARVMRRDKILA
jgi:hypothetical protein